MFIYGMAGSLTLAGDETLASGREAHHDNTYLCVVGLRSKVNS